MLPRQLQKYLLQPSNRGQQLSGWYPPVNASDANPTFGNYGFWESYHLWRDSVVFGCCPLGVGNSRNAGARWAFQVRQQNLWSDKFVTIGRRVLFHQAPSPTSSTACQPITLRIGYLSAEGWDSSDLLTEHEKVDVVRTLVGLDALEVTHVPETLMFVEDADRAQDVARGASGI